MTPALAILLSRVAAVVIAVTVALGIPAVAGAQTPPSAPDRLLVGFGPATSAAKAGRILANADATQLDSIPELGVRVVEVPAGGRRQALRSLRGADPVRFAERDGTATAQEMVPADPYFPQGNHSIFAGAWGWYRTHTTQAWDVTTGDPSVTVAILDTGLKAQGLDFDGQVVGPRNVLTGSSDVGSSSDNHGTYVAGVAGLAMNNGSGNAGYCPGCKIMPVQISNGSTAAWSDMATGVTWAVDHGARIINLSWAGSSPSSTIATAVAYARSKGAVVFAAAGNSNCNCPTYPAATAGVLGVGGVAQSGVKAGDSNFGNWVALAAPEGNMTAWPMIDGAPGYGPVGGTSLASPAAAGIAALVLSANPALTGSQLEQALKGSATPASFAVGYGEVDAMAALQSIGLSDPQPAGAPVNTIAPQVLVQTHGDRNTEPLANAPQAGQVLVRGQGAWTGSSPLALSGVKWYRCNPDGSGCAQVGSAWKYAVQSADSGYALKLTVTFTDPDGTTSASAFTDPVGGASPPPSGSAPSNTALPTVSGPAEVGATLTALTGSWLNSPTAYAYQWRRCDSAGVACSPVAGATAPSYALTSADVGSTMRVEVTATNGYGSGSATSDQTASIADAPAPAPPATTTSTFTGSLNAKQPAKSFNVAVGAGDSTATLTFSKASSMTLKLLAPDGSTVATASGPSGLRLARNLAPGTYRYVVSGSVTKGSASFTLRVDAAAP